MNKTNLIILVLSILPFYVRATEILKGSIFPLPGLIETAHSGLFIDVLDEIEKCLPGTVKINRTLYPPTRALSNLLGKKPVSDFAFPAISNPLKNVESPFYYTQPYGKVSFVIYSNKSRPLTADMLLSKANEKPYPYGIETFPYLQSYFPFPSEGFTCLECGLKKVSAGRLDGYIMAMDEVDAEIRKTNLPNLHRELYDNFDAVINTPKTARGKKVAAILSEAIECALKKGTIQKLYLKVHKPFEVWQPK
jgi:polar amino acid transport system substrate-binding protein